MSEPIQLPSGATLKIGTSPFEVSKALYMALLEEAKGLAFSTATERAQLFKDIFCMGFSSKRIEACLWKCFEKVQYCDERGDLKIDKDTFEPVKARGDYVAVCMAVAKENVAPFGNGLYAEYAGLFKTIADVLE